jgi:hypothetical protein
MGNSKLRWPTRTKADREIQAYRRTQNDDNFDKANQVPGMDEGNIFVSDGTGDLADSGTSYNNR